MINVFKYINLGNQLHDKKYNQKLVFSFSIIVSNKMKLMVIRFIINVFNRQQL